MCSVDEKSSWRRLQKRVRRWDWEGVKDTRVSMWQTTHAHTSPPPVETIDLPETERLEFHLLTALTPPIFPSPRMRSNHISALSFFRSSAYSRPCRGVLQIGAVARSSPSSIRSPVAADSVHSQLMLKSVDMVGCALPMWWYQRLSCAGSDSIPVREQPLDDAISTGPIFASRGISSFGVSKTC
jgi:hypothetical protein